MKLHVLTEERREHNYHDPTVEWTRVTQRIVKDGVTYERSWVKDKDCSGRPGHFTTHDERSKIGVLCGDCHGDAFRISYGSYEVIVTCVECGKTGEVYSG